MAGNGGMQTEEQGEEYPEYHMPYEAPGTVDAETNGGNTCLKNQDEDDMTASIIEATQSRSGLLSNEDDSHVMGVYKAQAADFAGS